MSVDVLNPSQILFARCTCSQLYRATVVTIPRTEYVSDIFTRHGHVIIMHTYIRKWNIIISFLESFNQFKTFTFFQPTRQTTRILEIVAYFRKSKTISRYKNMTSPNFKFIAFSKKNFTVSRNYRARLGKEFIAKNVVRVHLRPYIKDRYVKLYGNNSDIV